MTDSNGDCITYLSFCGALRRLNLVGHFHGLRADEMKELWLQADVDEKGFSDYKEFKVCVISLVVNLQQRIWNSSAEEADEENNEEWQSAVNGTERSIGFSVKAAVLFPTEAEKGEWPEE